MLKQLIAPLTSRLNIRNHPAVRQYLSLVLLTTVLFAALALVDTLLPKDVVTHFVLLLALSLVFGTLLAWLFEKKIFQQYRLMQRSLLLTAVVVWGMVLFAMISHGSKPEYQQVFLPTLTLVALPWFFWRAVRAAASVPQLRFAPFVFESLKDVIAAKRFAENESIGIRWSFADDFYELDPSGVYIFRTFCPKDLKNLELGYFFKCVISLHNITEWPQTPINFKSGQEFYGWEFYDYPYWWWPGRKRYLSPFKVISKSRIRFWRVSEDERAKSAVKLVPKFRAARVHVTRALESAQ